MRRLAALAAIVGAGALIFAGIGSTATDPGFKTAKPAYLVPIAPGVATDPIISTEQAREWWADGLRAAGPVKLRGASIDPRGDHRIAMAFAVAGLIAEGETEIKDADCVAVSFPEFFDLLESAVKR